MTDLQIGSSTMKQPRFDYFAPSQEQTKPARPLHSSLDNMPKIEQPPALPSSSQPNQDLAEPVGGQGKQVNERQSSKTKDAADITGNITSNITILPFLDTSDIEDLKEPATQVQSFRLTDANKEWLQEVAYRINKETKRGKVTQADVLRIAIKFFEKLYTLNKSEIKELLAKIK